MSATIAVFRAQGIPEPILEFKFHPERKWRFDFAWPAQRVALEVEGGIWTQGRHTRGSGFAKDIEKYNAAAVAGWRVVRCTPGTLISSATVDMVRALLK
jgi:very-short-patch-repair endonuclease